MGTSTTPGKPLLPFINRAVTHRKSEMVLLVCTAFSLLLFSCALFPGSLANRGASAPTSEALEETTLPTSQPPATQTPRQSTLSPEPTQTPALTVTEAVQPENQPSPTEAEETTPEGAVTTQVSPVDGMVMVFVPEGEFNMGSSTGDEDEQPVHAVWLDAFWIDQTEVTMAMYQQCVDDGSCEENPCTWIGKSYPAVCVDWQQAKTYCEWAGRRMPTEAEWEKAARGLDERTYPWGEEISLEMAHYDEDYTTEDSKPVGQYPQGASPYGALDMAGNAWEWVEDWYEFYYYKSQATWRNPTGPADTGLKIIRGGSWNSLSEELTTTYRGWIAPDAVEDDISFRCVTNQEP